MKLNTKSFGIGQVMFFCKNIDDFLGASSGRYFGSGYLRCSHSLHDFEAVSKNNLAEFSCSASVSYPEDWSRKANGNQAAHLSTIDVLELSQLAVRRWRELTMHSSNHESWKLVSIDVKAGRSPTSIVGARVSILGSITLRSGDIADVDLQVGNMHVKARYWRYFEVQKVATSKRSPAAIRNVMMDLNTLNVSSVVDPVDVDIESSWGISSVFSITLQLGQALMYGLDSVRREDSNTLWMKKVSIKAAKEMATMSMPQPVHVHLMDARRYTKPDGDWRRADICGVFANVSVVCSVTHRLPARQSVA